MEMETSGLSKDQGVEASQKGSASDSVAGRYFVACDQSSDREEGRKARNISRVKFFAGEVEVMSTLAASSEKIVEKDTNGESETITEEDSAGGNRRTTNIVNDETTVYGGKTDQEHPYVSKELTPQVEGVVVLAAGGDDAVVKKNITEAAQALFGIDTHKIRIIKMSEK